MFSHIQSSITSSSNIVREIPARETATEARITQRNSAILPSSSPPHLIAQAVVNSTLLLSKIEAFKEALGNYKESIESISRAHQRISEDLNRMEMELSLLFRRLSSRHAFG